MTSTIINRKELIEALEIVQPALSDNAMIPSLTHFWFLGNRVMAFNDLIGISTPCKTEFRGAVPGKTLLAMLKAATNEEVELLPDNTGNFLRMTLGNAKIRLPLMPPDEKTFIEEMPKPQKNSPLPAGKDDFFTAISSCMRSISSDTSVPDQLGITMIEEGDTLSFYSTDNATLSIAQIKMKANRKENLRVILAAQFCEQMLRLGKEAKDTQLEIHKDEGYTLFVAGKNILFGHVVESAQPLDYEAILDHHLTPGYGDKMIALPPTLKTMLDRACVITDSKVDETKTSITVRDGKLRFFSESKDRGEVDETITLKKSHPDVDICLNPKLLRAGYDKFDHILITDTCVIMSKGDLLYLISATEG